MAIKTKKVLIDPGMFRDHQYWDGGNPVNVFYEGKIEQLPGARAPSMSGQLPQSRNDFIVFEKLIGKTIPPPNPRGAAPKPGKVKGKVPTLEIAPGGGLRPIQTTVPTVPTKKVWDVPTLPEVSMGSVTDIFSNIVSGITDYQVAKVSQPNNPFIPDLLEFGWAGQPTTTAEVVIDNGTGQVVNVRPACKKRRRRRRLATASDLKDLAALKAILGGGKSLDTWLATRGRR